MKALLLVTVVSALLLTAGCTKEHEDLPTSFIYDPPSAPLDLEVTGCNQLALLDWDYPSEEMGRIVEFRVYYYY